MGYDIELVLVVRCSGSSSEPEGLVVMLVKEGVGATCIAYGGEATDEWLPD